MKWIDCVRDFGFDPYALVLSIGAIFVLWVLWKLQRSKKQVDFMDLLVDDSGKASWSKMTAIGGWMIGSWSFVHKTLHTGIDTGDLLVYMAVCAGSPIAFAIIKVRAGLGTPDPPTSTTTVSTTVQGGATVQVQQNPTSQPPA